MPTRAELLADEGVSPTCAVLRLFRAESVALTPQPRLAPKAQRVAAHDHAILGKFDRRDRAAAELLYAQAGEWPATGRAAHAQPGLGDVRHSGGGGAARRA